MPRRTARPQPADPASYPLVLLLELQLHRRAHEVEALAQAVLQKALVVVRDQVGPVHEEREVRRARARLRHVLHTQNGLAVAHRVPALADAGEPRVQLVRGDGLAEVLVRPVDGLPDAVDLLAGAPFSCLLYTSGLAPRCRLIASWGWSRSQGYGCSPFKAVRELGSERRETVRSLSSAGAGESREAAPSTRGPGWTHLW